MKQTVHLVNMGGYSSDGCSSLFTLEKQNDRDDQWMQLVGLVEDHKTEVSATNGRLIDSVMDQGQLNQVEISEGSYQMKSDGRRPKLTLAQKRENKRLSDYRYRQKRKITADELTAENKHSKAENERLIAENTLLKSLLSSLLSNGRDENVDSKAEAEPEPSSGSGQPLGQNAKPPEPPTQDYVCLRARRAQAIVCHKAMTEQISESTKILKDLIPCSSKVQGAVMLDQIFSYIQSLQREVELQFLSMELAAVNPRTKTAVEAFPHKDLNCVNIIELQNLLEIIPVNDVPDPKKPEAGTSCNDVSPVSDLLMKIEADEESNVTFSDFSGLDGDRLKLGKYSFPHSVIPTLERILDACGDISEESKMNPSITETVYVMFCACVKEMNDLRLEEVSEDRILKWRDVIKDALRICFKVDFVMEHLKKIAHAYIGLTERRKMKNLVTKMSKLEDDLSSGKQELAKIYKQSKVYIDVADDFNGKFVGSGMFPSLDTTKCAQIKYLL